MRVTGAFGRPVGAGELRAATPIAPGGMTLDQFCRAAVRLGYRVRRVPLTGMPPDGRALTAIPAPYLLLGRPAEDGSPGAHLVEAAGPDGLTLFNPLDDSSEIVPPAVAAHGLGATEAVLVRPQAGALREEPDWRAKMAKRLRGVLGELVLASLVLNMLALATPLFTMTLYNKVIGQQSLSTLNVLALGMVVVYGFDVVLRIVRGYISSHTGGRLDALIGGEVMHHLMNLPFRHFEQTPSGLIAERVRQLDTIRSFFTGQMPMTLVDMTFVVVFLAALFFIHPVLACITLAAMPLFIGLSLLFHRRQRTLVEQSFRAQAAKSSHLVETMQNALSIKALGLEPEIERRWEQRLALSAWTSFRASNLNNVVAACGQGLQMLTQLTILYVGAQLVIAGETTIGALIAGNILATRTLAPLRMIVVAWIQLQEVRAAFERIDSIMSEPGERTPTDSAAAPRLAGRIVVEGLAYGFEPGQPPVLRDLDLTVPQGTVLGIIGPSGSGKTTLVRLLQGLYQPTQGRVLYDGHDLAHISAASLRHQLGVVPQETQLFAGTIRENVLFGSDIKDPERVVAVCKFVGAHDFIQRLPRAYETPLGERGSGLSAGQRQLLCIARALIRNPRVLILDEATSDLDPVAEERLLRHLQRASKGRTVVLISHRLSPFAIADRVALLMNGRIERVGPPAEVIAFARARMAEAADADTTA
ncbi:peptidase domain-containing ABC transporter [Tistlia consotensis]|nr:peptidase domain-containing ABC transporter [Tistlia consotensis]